MLNLLFIKRTNHYGEVSYKINPIAIKCALVVAIVSVVLGINSIDSIPANHVGVVFNKIDGGIQDKYIKPGWRFHAPFVETVYDISTRTHSLHLKPSKDKDGNVFDKSITTQTKDGQWLATQADVQYRVLPENAVHVFNQFYQRGVSMDDKIKEQMVPVIQRSVEAVTSQFDIVSALGAERTKMQQMIEQSVSNELLKYGITMQSFTLVDTDAGDEIEKAIAQEAIEQQAIQTVKQQQEKQRISNEIELEKAQAEAERKEIAAKAEAEANKKIADSVTPELIQYKEAEARIKHGWLEVQTQQAIVDTGK